jgi:hypothetical protein
MLVCSVLRGLGLAVGVVRLGVRLGLVLGLGVGAGWPGWPGWLPYGPGAGAG